MQHLPDRASSASPAREPADQRDFAGFVAGTSFGFSASTSWHTLRMAVSSLTFPSPSAWTISLRGFAAQLYLTQQGFPGSDVHRAGVHQVQYLGQAAGVKPFFQGSSPCSLIMRSTSFISQLETRLGVAAVSLDRCFKIIREPRSLVRISASYSGRPYWFDKALAARQRQLGQSGQDRIPPVVVQPDRQQVRLAEIAVIRLGFLGAHLFERAGVFIPFQRPGLDAPPGFHLADLALDFLLMASRTASIELTFLISVLGLRIVGALWADGHVGVAAQVSLFPCPLRRSPASAAAGAGGSGTGRLHRRSAGPAR